MGRKNLQKKIVSPQGTSQKDYDKSSEAPQKFLAYQTLLPSFGSVIARPVFVVLLNRKQGNMLFIILSFISAFAKLETYNGGIRKGCEKVFQLTEDLRNLDTFKSDSICSANQNLYICPPPVTRWPHCREDLRGSRLLESLKKEIHQIKMMSVLINEKVIDVARELHGQCTGRGFLTYGPKRHLVAWRALLDSYIMPWNRCRQKCELWPWEKLSQKK